ncbi:unnamed protein product, partial [Ceratitis capitata]
MAKHASAVKNTRTSHATANSFALRISVECHRELGVQRSDRKTFMITWQISVFVNENK